ncbi:hypothetical protein BH24ACT4_BH24ACT4_14410 [soil metagenome]
MAGTFVYIDGFNLYHRALKDSAYKWLDLERFCDQVVDHRVDRVRYFTAPVKELAFNPGARARQFVYWRALKTLPRVRIHEGKFVVNSKWRALHHEPVGMKPASVVARVKVPEEKGSDVNLASWLLMDAFRGRYDAAVVVSNDSDLVEPVRMVVHELGLPVAILNPSGSTHDQLKGTTRLSLTSGHLNYPRR